MKTVTTLKAIYKPRRNKKCLGIVPTLSTSDYEGLDMNSKAVMIDALIPLGLMMINELIEEEITDLLGGRYNRDERPQGLARYGSNPGSVSLAGQRFKREIPRVRDVINRREIKLKSIEALRCQGQRHNESLLKRVLWGLSCRNYAQAAEALPEALGLSASTVSRKFIEASEKELAALNTRELSSYDFTGLVIDGKSCADELILIAIGITLNGQKIPLGIAQMGSENERAVSEFLVGLETRGFSAEEGLLVVIDGSKGIHAAVKKVFGQRAVIQRCQWHKRENVVSYLPKEEQALWRKRLQNAYQKTTYTEAKQALDKLKKELALKNRSALASLEEGFEETLTLHRLRLFQELGFSLKTTNGLESINSLIEKCCGKVSYYKNSSQRLRWYAAALLDVEPRLHRINGHQHLSKLRQALQKDLKIKNEFAEAA